MSLSVGANYVNSYHEGKKGYVDKFEKSLKSPFLMVLSSHLPMANAADEDLKFDASDVAVSDNVELSSAVVTSTGASESDTGVNSGA